MKKQFKVGDRVKVSSGVSSFLNRAITNPGTITAIDSRTGWHTVKMDHGGIWRGVEAKDMRLIEETDPAVLRGHDFHSVIFDEYYSLCATADLGFKPGHAVRLKGETRVGSIVDVTRNNGLATVDWGDGPMTRELTCQLEHAPAKPKKLDLRREIEFPAQSASKVIAAVWHDKREKDFIVGVAEDVHMHERFTFRCDADGTNVTLDGSDGVSWITLRNVPESKSLTDPAVARDIDLGTKVRRKTKPSMHGKVHGEHVCHESKLTPLKKVKYNVWRSRGGKLKTLRASEADFPSFIARVIHSFELEGEDK